MKRPVVLLSLIAVVSLSLPSAARADWLLSPFVGATFGGATEGEHLTYGGSIGYMGARVIGVEVDFGHASDLLNDRYAVDSSATTLMANIIVGVPIGAERGARPYVSGGAGLLRTRITDVDEFFDIDDNSFGVNVGAGVHAFFTDNVGMRADVRYFRTLEDSDSTDDVDLDFGRFDFWRATVGASFRF